MQLTHLGHSCVLIQGGQTRVLLDPGNLTPGFEQLRGLDAVAITHQHPDHVDLERLPGLVAANPGVRLLAEPSTVPQLAAQGLSCAALSPGDAVQLGELHLQVVGGEHALIHDDIPRVGNVGLLIAGPGGPLMFHPGDSYSTVPEGVDVLLLPLTAPWSSIRETVAFARAVAAPEAVPIHDGGASPGGRAVYLRLVGSLVDGVRLRDLAGAGAVDW
jgi:L-ascorbate metabolism protein UlaG (beta-lactamase superfamily)